MKSTLPMYLIAASLAAAPLTASADYCSPGKKYMKHGYYGHPHYHKHQHPMHSRHYYPAHPKAYWKGEKPYGKRGPAPQASDYAPAEAPPSAATANIIDTAVNAGTFTALVDALNATGLDKTLQGSGPYTVFAPSDEAFNKLPDTIRTALINDKDALTALLTYHVVPGEVSAADAARLNSAETVQGSTISIDATNGIKVDGANVVTADIQATNGIIHVIDAVLIPN